MRLLKELIIWGSVLVLFLLCVICVGRMFLGSAIVLICFNEDLWLLKYLVLFAAIFLALAAISSTTKLYRVLCGYGLACLLYSWWQLIHICKPQIVPILTGIPFVLLAALRLWLVETAPRPRRQPAGFEVISHPTGRFPETNE